ncbi:MAG: UvrD-helicase domain-containing protein [Candidatus Sedimenticola sp. (ex Thyasira tokunagai)]
MPHQLEGLIAREDIAHLAENEQLILDDNKRISILEAMRSIDVQAIPGSGKTTLIATKLILLAKKWPLQHQGVCVLSHTNVAKEEIIGRLKRTKSLEAQRLLSYPHFIGTIQEFVGKFVAFPLIRTSGTSINMVDTDICVDLIYSKLSVRTRGYVDRKSQHSNVLYDFDLDYVDGGILVNVPTFPNGSTSQSYINLEAVRKELITDGYFFYRDVFSYAMMALRENSALPTALRQRFPCVFLDEMQDTQKFQDELLCEIFPLDDPDLIVQRFGDPDQAIFHGIGNEEPNESFNGKSRDDMDFIVYKSHRFDDVLASKIKPVSFNEIPLKSELSEEALAIRAESHATGENFEHTILLFNDDTCDNVIESFSQIVSNQFTEQRKRSQCFSVKVVGAVGNEIDPNKVQLKIGHYWAGYDKTKLKTNFKAASLLEAVRYCRQSSSIDWADNYKLLIDCILKLMRISGKHDSDGRYYSSSTLRDALKEKGRWNTFRDGIYLMLNETIELDHKNWEDICSLLIKLLDFENIPNVAMQYMEFAEVPGPDEIDNDVQNQEELTLVALTDNKLRYKDDFQIELSTIHGVKGETHDATLIVETKNHIFDLETMLPYFTGELPSEDHPNRQLPEKPNARRAFKQNKVFLRQLYVAMSRPKHLLCLAIHEDRISNEDIRKLENLDWHIHVIEKPSQETN